MVSHCTIDSMFRAIWAICTSMMTTIIHCMLLHRSQREWCSVRYARSSCGNSYLARVKVRKASSEFYVRTPSNHITDRVAVSHQHELFNNTQSFIAYHTHHPERTYIQQHSSDQVIHSSVSHQQFLPCCVIGLSTSDKNTKDVVMASHRILEWKC